MRPGAIVVPGVREKDPAELPLVEAERLDSPLEVRAVDPIPIPDHIPGGRLPRERLDHLLRSPLGGRVCGHGGVENSSSLQAQHYEYKQQPEGHRNRGR